MIRIRKSEPPAVLVINADRWLIELKAAILTGENKTILSKKSRYNHQHIKDAVSSETHGKCAYCEAEVRSVSHGDIEHIFPKSADIDKTFEWRNLGFACQKCNQNKSDINPIANNILDPYEVDPQPYILFFGAFISSNGTLVGRQTISLLKLDRAPLLERRQLVYKNLIQRFEMIQMARSPEEKSILIEDFKNNELGDNLEFSAMRRDFWNSCEAKIEDKPEN